MQEARKRGIRKPNRSPKSQQEENVVVYKPSDYNEKLPFKADQLITEMDESRVRVKKLAAPYPGCWNWCKEHRPDLLDRLKKYKSDYDKAFDDMDGPLCCKWGYAIEQTAKSIVLEYSKVLVRVARRPTKTAHNSAE